MGDHIEDAAIAALRNSYPHLVEHLRSGRNAIVWRGQQEPIVQTLLRKPTETEVIITGRCKNQPAYFDLVSIHAEMVCHKHSAEQGVDLKRGVDY